MVRIRNAVDAGGGTELSHRCISLKTAKSRAAFEDIAFRFFSAFPHAYTTDESDESIGVFARGMITALRVVVPGG